MTHVALLEPRPDQGRPTVHTSGRVAVCALLSSLIGLSGCTAVQASSPPARPPSAAQSSLAPDPARAVPTPDHVVIVVLENKDVDQILGDPGAPYLQSLAARSAEFTDAHAETHPSQPNYIALFSGAQQGITNDKCADELPAPSLGGRLIAAGRTFTGYAEDLPEVGFTGCQQGDYVRKHNPWVNFTDVPDTANRPLSDLPSDYSQLPTLSFVIPNLCHDMHDCDVAAGDRWMRDHIDEYASWANTHNSMLIVTFDESASAGGGNRIVTLFTGAMVQPGRYGERIDHYRMLRTLEDMYGLAPLGRSASIEPITDVWVAAR